MSEIIGCKTTYDCDGIDPDPLTLIFTWLGAVGSVASIVSWVEQMQDVKQDRWLRNLDDSSHYLCLQKATEVESDLALLSAQIEKIEILLLLAQTGTVNGQPMMVPPSLNQAPLQFGGVRLNLPDELMKEFVRFHKETATISKRIGVNVISLIQELSLYKFHLAPEVAHNLVAFREHLNTVLRSGSYLEAVANCKTSIKHGKTAIFSLKGALQRG